LQLKFRQEENYKMQIASSIIKEYVVERVDAYIYIQKKFVITLIVKMKINFPMRHPKTYDPQ
jgi:hypothetical protein